MTWVGIAVACPPYSCQVNNDKVVLWEGPGRADCSLEIRTEGFQVMLVCFECGLQLLGGCLQHEVWPEVSLKVWRGPPFLFAVGESHLSLSI